MPLQRGLTNLSAPDVERDPHYQDGTTDAGHGAKGFRVAVLVNPGVCVEGEEKPKACWNPN